MTAPKLTLDTNVIARYLQMPQAGNTAVLIDLAKRGEVDLAVTNRIREDVPHDPLAAELNRLPLLEISEVGAVFRLDFSRLDGPDMLGSSAFGAAAIRLTGPSGEPNRVDWDHLEGHWLNSRDYFLTWERAILGVAPALEEGFGLRIRRPDLYLREFFPAEAPDPQRRSTKGRRSRGADHQGA